MRGSVTTMAKRRGRRTVWLAPAAVLAAVIDHGYGLSGRAGPPRTGQQVTKVTISPGQGAVDDRPDLGVAVSASGGRLTDVTVKDARGDEVAGYLGPGGMTWHSTWALASPQTYAVTATAIGRARPDGHAVRDIQYVRARADLHRFGRHVSW